MDKVTLYGEYREGCFCDRKPLGELANVDYRPRFEFQKAAQLWARFNGAIFGGMNKGTTTRSAWAYIPQPCNHRERQLVSIEWTTQY